MPNSTFTVRQARIAASLQSDRRPRLPVGAHPRDRSLTALQSGTQLSIHQALGAGSTGCRLDAGAPEANLATVARGPDQRRPDLLVVDCSGKREAGCRGAAPQIAQAVEAAIPDLVAVNGLNREALDAFARGLAQKLPDESLAVPEWLVPYLGQRAASGERGCRKAPTRPRSSISGIRCAPGASASRR